MVDVLGRLRLLDGHREHDQRRLLVPILLHLQVHPCPLDGSTPDWWRPDLVPIRHPTYLLSLLLPHRLHLR